jgi:hypothetical protein
MDKELKRRPYWHVDAKWIFGIMLVAVMSFTILIYNIVKLTEPDMGVEIMTTFMAVAFSPNGLDDQTEIDEMRKRLNKENEAVQQPIEGLKIYLTKNEIDNLSPRELRLYIFKQIATPLYNEGLDGIDDLADNDEVKEQIKSSLGYIAIINHTNHLRLKSIFNSAAIISVILLIPFIYFSFGIGRISNIGSLLLNIGLPGIVSIYIVNNIIEKQVNLISVDDNGVSLVQQLGQTILPSMLAIFYNTYMVIFIVGSVLILFSLLLRLTLRIRKKC